MDAILALRTCHQSCCSGAVGCVDDMCHIQLIRYPCFPWAVLGLASGLPARYALLFLN